MWKDINLERLKKCVKNKSEFDLVFPEFIIRIGDKVKQELGNEFSDMQEWVGPYAREKTKQLHPEMKEPFYLDWVCFGFEGYPPEEAHVGVLFDLANWPITYVIGVHALDYIWGKKEEVISTKRKELKENPYQYAYQKAFKEHQLNDLAKELDCSNLQQELVVITNRIHELYTAFNPLIKKEKGE